MARVISGPKGSGKTKRMIDNANEKVAEGVGEIVFMNDREKYRVKLDNSIRYVNAEDFFISSPDVLFGFLSGLIAENYDINTIYIDNVLRILKLDHPSKLEPFIQQLEKLEKQYNVTFVLSVSSAEEDLPEFLKKVVC
ncbi:MAG TPA: hypothetical protein DHN33_09415 [Eubacteriaceae bacterium]|nr:hypothetical protein [Eubacteriaceae bacterium]